MDCGNPSRAEAQPPKVMTLSTMEIVSYSFFSVYVDFFFLSVSGNIGTGDGIIGKVDYKHITQFIPWN